MPNPAMRFTRGGRWRNAQAGELKFMLSRLTAHLPVMQSEASRGGGGDPLFIALMN